MSDETTTKEERGPDRWSAQAKSEVVLRLMRGEAIDQVSRAVQVPAHQRGGPHPLDRFSSQPRWNPGFMIQAA